MERVKNLGITKYITVICFIVILVLSVSVFSLLSCTAGVAIGEADLILDGFTITWPDGFNCICNPGESYNITVTALSQKGESFNWSGQVNVVTTNTDVDVSPAIVFVQNGTATVNMQFSHDLQQDRETYLLLSAEGKMKQLPENSALTVTTGPEIKVWYKCDYVPPPPAVPVYLEGYLEDGADISFTTIDYGGIIEFKIENDADTSALHLTGDPLVSSTNYLEDFSCTQPSAATINAQESTSFQLEYHFPYEHQDSTSLSISHDDQSGGENPFNITVTINYTLQ